MSIYIITDSASDISRGELENVRVIPLTVTINDVSYKDGVDLQVNEFYRILESGETIPVTSQVNPHQYAEVYEELRSRGDEAIVLALSSALSGTYQSALIAAADYDNVSVIDTLQATASEKLLVLRALELIGKGWDRASVVSQLEKEKHEVVIYGVVDTLKYLLKGGRISKSSAVIGGVLGIKPIITLENGKVESIGKARGSKQSHIFLNKKIEEVGGIDTSRPYAVGYSGSDPSNLNAYLQYNSELLQTLPHEPITIQVGSTIGTHAGPGAVLVSFFRNSD